MRNVKLLNFDETTSSFNQFTLDFAVILDEFLIYCYDLPTLTKLRFVDIMHDLKNVNKLPLHEFILLFNIPADSDVSLFRHIRDIKFAYLVFFGDWR